MVRPPSSWKEVNVPHSCTTSRGLSAAATAPHVANNRIERAFAFIRTPPGLELLTSAAAKDSLLQCGNWPGKLQADAFRPPRSIDACDTSDCWIRQLASSELRVTRSRA